MKRNSTNEGLPPATSMDGARRPGGQDRRWARAIMRVMRSRLARSSLLTTGMLGIRVATQAILLLLLVRLFDPDVYGNLVAAATLAVVLGLLPNLGAGYVLMARTPGSDEAAAGVWGYAWPTTVLLGLLFLFAYLPAARLLGGDHALPWDVLLWLGATELLLTPFTMLFVQTLQSREQVPLGQFVQWLPLGLRAAAVLPCFFAPPQEQLALYVQLQFAASALGLLAGLSITRRHARLAWPSRRPTVQEVREGASYAAMHLVAANSFELDKIVAVRAVGAHDAGLYNAMSRIVVALAMPVLAMLASAQPRLFRHGHEPTAQGRRLIWVIATIAATWGAASAAVLAACSPLLPLLLGDAYVDTSRLMPLAAVTALFLSLRFAAGTVLVALGRPMERIMFEVCGIAMLALGILALAPMLQLRGLILAAISSEATMAAVGWWLVRRRMRAGNFAGNARAT